MSEISPAVKINSIELNTIDNPSNRFIDETERTFCSRCRNWLALGCGMVGDPTIYALTMKHLEVCTGNVGETLLKIDEWYQAGGLADQLTGRSGHFTGNGQYKGKFYGCDRIA